MNAIKRLRKESRSQDRQEGSETLLSMIVLVNFADCLVAGQNKVLAKRKAKPQQLNIPICIFKTVTSLFS